MNKQDKIWKLVQHVFARQSIPLDDWSRKDSQTWLGELSLADAGQALVLIERNMTKYRDQRSSYPLAKRIFPKKDAMPDCLTAKLIAQVQSDKTFKSIKEKVREDAEHAVIGLDDSALLKMTYADWLVQAVRQPNEYGWLLLLLDRTTIVEWLLRPSSVWDIQQTGERNDQFWMGCEPGDPCREDNALCLARAGSSFAVILCLRGNLFLVSSISLDGWFIRAIRVSNSV